jgi:hypothetical protein
MKKIIPLLILCLASATTFSQKYISDLNHVSFYSEAPMENIEAHTYNSKSIFDVETGEIAFIVPINTFEFKKSLMQEHFNEKFMESHKYPRAKFKGKVIDFKNSPGKQKVTAEGEMEIHGVTQNVKVTGDLESTGNEVKINAVFPVKVADYNIKIPSVVATNIAEVVEVRLDFTYRPHDVQ